MTIEEALRTFIEQNIPTAGKGYPLEVPGDAAFPAWAYQAVDDEQVLAHAGGSGFHKSRIQIDLMAQEAGGLSDYANAKAIAAAVIAALDGYRGAMSDRSVHYCHVLPSDDWSDVHKLPVQKLDVLINYR